MGREQESDLTHDLMQTGRDYTPYEGMEVTGWPVKTLVRGKVVAEDGEVVGAPGFGQFLPRETTRRPEPAARS